jgi:hypothetical protein
VLKRRYSFNRDRQLYYIHRHIPIIYLYRHHNEDENFYQIGDGKSFEGCVDGKDQGCTCHRREKQDHEEDEELHSIRLKTCVQPRECNMTEMNEEDTGFRDKS